MFQAGHGFIDLAINTAALGKSLGATKRLLSGVGTVGKVAFLGLSAGVASAGAAMAGFIAANKGGELITARLEGVLKATGNTAGRTRDQILDMATALQGKSIFEDDDIVDSARVLATFTNIRNEIFDQANELSLDLAASLGSKPVDAAKMLGRALQEPKEGLTLLRRSGIVFTDAQKEMIETLIESGRGVEAQGIILKQLEGTIGGVAKAMGDTFHGKLTQVWHRIGAISENIGAKLEPYFAGLIDTMDNAIDPISKLVDETFNLVDAWWELAKPLRDIGLIFFGKVADFMKSAIIGVTTAVKDLGTTFDVVSASLAVPVAKGNDWLSNLWFGLKTGVGATWRNRADIFQMLGGKLEQVISQLPDAPFMDSASRAQEAGNLYLQGKRTVDSAIISMMMRETLRGTFKDMPDALTPHLETMLSDAFAKFALTFDGVWNNVFGKRGENLANQLPPRTPFNFGAGDDEEKKKKKEPEKEATLRGQVLTDAVSAFSAVQQQVLKSEAERAKMLLAEATAKATDKTAKNTEQMVRRFDTLADKLTDYFANPSIAVLG